MIDNVRMTAVVPIAGGTAGKAESGKATATTRTEKTPTSSASLPQLLSLVANLSEGGAPIDYAKIAQVRRAIADRSYQIDPDALAKAIVAHVSPE